MKTIVIILLTATTLLQGQSFSNFQTVPERSDRDFTVQWSNGGPAILVDMQKNGRFVKESRAYYMTVVHGKGKLTSLTVNRNSTALYPNTNVSVITALIAVEGLKDHAIWHVFMDPNDSYNSGVKFWHLGDIIYLDTETILTNDDRIPKIQNGNLTENISPRLCGGRDLCPTGGHSCNGSFGCWDGHKWQQ